MHSSVYKGITVHYNGDYSGDVKINVPTYHPKRSYDTSVVFHDMKEQRERFEKLLHSDEDLMPDFYEVTVPYAFLEEVVADKVRREIVSEIERMDTEDIMKILARRAVT